MTRSNFAHPASALSDFMDIRRNLCITITKLASVIRFLRGSFLYCRLKVRKMLQ